MIAWGGALLLKYCKHKPNSAIMLASYTNLFCLVILFVFISFFFWHQLILMVENVDFHIDVFQFLRANANIHGTLSSIYCPGKIRKHPK